MNPSALRRNTPWSKDQAEAKMFLGYTLICGIPAFFSIPAALSGAMVAALCYLAIAFSARKERPFYAEPIALISIVWFLAAGLPTLVPGLYQADYYRRRVSPELIDLSALWLYRSWFALCVGYLAARVNYRVPPAIAIAQRARVLEQERRFELILGVIGLLGLALMVVLRGRVSMVFSEADQVETGSIEQIASYMKTFGMVYLFMVAARSGSLATNFSKDRIGLLNLLGAMVFGALGGAKGALFGPLVAIALGYGMSSYNKSHPGRDLLLAAVGAISVVLLSSIIAAYRFQLLSHPMPDSFGFGQVVLYQLDALWTAMRLAVVGDAGANANMLARFSHLTGLALVFSVSGGESPYQGAFATFLTPLYAIVPRDFLPFKVIFFNSAQMAKLMGWTFGGLSVTTPGSIYWALGYNAIMPVFLTIGWLLSRLLIRSRQGSFRPVIRLVFVPLAILLMDVGAEFHSMIINSIRFAIIGAALMWIIQLLPPTFNPRISTASRGSR
jgi:hypothetical protein